jgi:hypothetical protein
VRFLLHGTSMKSILGIKDTGFNPLRTTTHAYGKGTYFAEALSVAAGYIRKGGGANEEHSVLLARVAVGRQSQGASHMTGPARGLTTLCTGRQRGGGWSRGLGGT